LPSAEAFGGKSVESSEWKQRRAKKSYKTTCGDSLLIIVAAGAACKGRQLQASSADNCTQKESRELEGEDDSADPFLLWFHVILMMRFLLHVLCFLVPPPFPVPLFALTLPHRLEAMADALLGMCNIDLLLLLLQVRVMQTRNWELVS
jgi:hypothetical protein